jgi:hypothetical protein
MSGLLLSSQLARAAEITIEGDAPLKSITVTLEGGTSKDVVRELSQKYGFEVQGLDNINSDASLSTTMSGNLRSIVESVLRNCNYMLFRSTDNKSGIDRVIIVNCTHGPAPSPGRTQDQPTDIPQQQLLDAGQLDQLVAPVALYADPLLAQVLVASTYPLEVVQAESFAKANKKLKGDKLKEALAKQDWDTSVKELVSIPPVLAMMNDKLDWTQSLGDAVLAQQADVMDAIQRLRAKAHSNGKLESTEQQTVMVTQEAEQRVIEIEPASPEVVYVPYYDPAVVYGEWPYPDYPPYYYAPPNYIVGGAIATGLAWGAAYLIGRAIWDDIEWDRGDINIDIDRDIDIGRNANIDGDFKKWRHNSYHRRGVAYDNDAVKKKFAKADTLPADPKLAYRGRSGEQVLKAGKGEASGADRPGFGDRPNLGGPGQRPDIGQIQQGLNESLGRQASLPGHKPDLGTTKAKSRPAVNAFDPSDGLKARDFSNRGSASLGNRGASHFAPTSRGGGYTAVRRGGGGGTTQFRGSGGGRGHVSRGGGGRGGGRRSDLRLKEDIVPLAQLENGLGLYRFRYKGRDQTIYVGVMAQEVQQIDPSAVWRDRSGYLIVNYDRIGLKFMTWRDWLGRTGASSTHDLGVQGLDGRALNGTQMRGRSP